MKCINHNDREAIGICINCGKGLCPECVIKSDKGKILCSNDCADFHAKFEDSIEIIREKTLKQNKASAYGSFIMGVLFVIFGIFHFFERHVFLPLAIFVIAVGIAMLFWGTRFLKVSKNNNT